MVTGNHTCATGRWVAGHRRPSLGHKQGREERADTVQMVLHHVTRHYCYGFRWVWEPHRWAGGIEAVCDEAETPPGAQRGRHDHSGGQSSDPGEGCPGATALF